MIFHHFLETGFSHFLEEETLFGLFAVTEHRLMANCQSLMHLQSLRGEIIFGLIAVTEHLLMANSQSLRENIR